MNPVLTENYITQVGLDRAIEGLKSEIAELSEKLNQKIDAVLQESKTGLSQEKLAREQAIDSLQSHVEAVQKNVAEASEKTNKRLEAIDDKLSGITSKLERINGGLDGWTQAMEASKHLHEQNSQSIAATRKELSDLNSEVDGIQQRQTQQFERLDQVHKTIHGANEDGPDSLFGALAKLQLTIETNTSAQHSLITSVQDEARQNTSALTLIRADKERWDARLGLLKSGLAAIWQDKRVLAFLLTLLATLVLGVSPELRELVVSALKEILNNAS